MARKTTSTKKATPRKAGSTRKESPTSRTQKPVFRAGTWLTLLFLAGLIGFAFYLKREKAIAAEATPPTSDATGYVFITNEGNTSSIEIKPADASLETFRMARNEKKEWVIELPLEAEAEQGLAEGAASEIFTLKVVSPVDGNPDDYGFDNPDYIFTIGFDSGIKHTLEIGDRTPTNSGYYARLDKDKMMVIDMDGIDYLLQNRMFPPYLNPPTPTPLPATATPVPPTEAVPSPEATITVPPTP